MTLNIRVKKRSGELEPCDFSKINKVVEHACKGIEGVSVSEIIRNARIHLVDGTTTERIQEILIKTSRDLISAETPNYTFVNSRLDLYDVRKRAFGSHTPPSLYTHISNCVDLGVYDRELLTVYSKKDIDELDAVLDHSRDDTFSSAAVGQLTDKYLLRDRSKGSRAFYETPQFLYMCVGMALMSVYEDREFRMKNVKRFYEKASTFDFSLPTPIMSGARTPTRQFSSCVLIKCGDTLPSINATATAITNYVSKRAGIGIDASAIRAEGSAIRNGEMVHTGIIPFLKYHVSALKSCSQGGIRGGSGTVYYPWWHLQFEDIIALKNNKGTFETRERRVDYGVQLNGFLLKKFLDDEEVWLLDTKGNEDMYEAFFANQGLFEAIYQERSLMAENGKIRGKKIKASEIIHEITEQRSETGRIYIAFVDNINRQGPFNPVTHPVYQSNLCFTGDTMVAIADGSNMVSIADLANRQQPDMNYHVYSARESKTKVGGFWKTEIKGAVAVKTGSNQPVVKVMLDNGDTFRCTPNHLLARPDGTWVAAEHAIGEELQGFFTGTANPSDPKVVAVVPDGLEDVYCLQVEDNHNFNIITNNDPMNSRGILVHNCLEITLPTREFESEFDEKGRIALCTLSSINMMKFKNAHKDPKEFEELMETIEVVVTALDGLLSYQDYMMIQAKLSTDEFRTLGVGVVNYASFLAYHNAKYGSEAALEIANSWFERFAYCLTSASIGLAEKLGPCKLWKETVYGVGEFPFEYAKKSLFELTRIKQETELDWEPLRERLKASGIRNATLSAIAPTESSSQVLNATNGVEMPQEFISVKSSKSGNFRQCVPYPELEYEYLWEHKDCSGYLKQMAVTQRWIDQAISSNTFHNPELWEGGKIPRSVLVEELVQFYVMGGKTLYYSKMPDGASDVDKEADIKGSEQPIVDTEVCSNCVI